MENARKGYPLRDDGVDEVSRYGDYSIFLLGLARRVL